MDVRQEMAHELGRRVLLEEVAGALDPRQLRMRHAFVQPVGVLGRKYPVLTSPDDAYGERQLGQQMLVLDGVGLVDLAVLAIEGGLSVRSAPRVEERVQDTGTEADLCRVPQVARDQRFVSVGRELIEDVGMVQDESEETAFPFTAADGVEEREVAVDGTFDEQCAQRYRAPDVMGDDAGTGQPQ